MSASTSPEILRPAAIIGKIGGKSPLDHSRCWFGFFYSLCVKGRPLDHDLGVFKDRAEGRS
jgi:hypothetical protein